MTLFSTNTSVQPACTTNVHHPMGDIAGLREVHDDVGRRTVSAFPVSMVKELSPALASVPACYIGGSDVTSPSANSSDDVSGNPDLTPPKPTTPVWPFSREDAPPVALWRTLPPDAFGDAERLLLLATLEQIDVLHGGADFAAALKGDPAAAIGVAFSLMPIEEITLRSDIAMTALLQCALERNAAAALVLAQVLGLTDLGHPYAIELAASWLAYGKQSSDCPLKFSKAETILLAAFRDRHLCGDEA